MTIKCAKILLLLLKFSGNLSSCKLHMIVGLSNTYLFKEIDADQHTLPCLRYRNTSLHQPESSMTADLHDSNLTTLFG